MECLDKNVVVKLLKHVVVCCCVVNILLSCNLRASQFIDQTPELVVDVSNASVSIPKQFLVLCQWIMKGNVLEGQVKQQAFLQFAQNLESSRELLRPIAGGRNIVLTKIHGNPVMFLTGIGPACTSQQKDEFETMSGIKLVDIVEILPCEEGEKRDVRDVMFKMGPLRSLANKLFEYLAETSGKAFKVRPLLMLKKDMQRIGELPDPTTSELFRIMINAIDEVKSSIQKTDYNNLLNIEQIGGNVEEKGTAVLRALEFFQSHYQEIRNYYNEYFKKYFTALSSVLEIYHPDADKQGLARKGLENMCRHNHNKEFDLVVTMLRQVETGVSPKESLFGIGGREIFGYTDSLDHEQLRIIKNFGNVFHSEVIYYYYLQCNQLQPNTYFFTQRDLCETCRPVVNGRSEGYGMNVVVLSAIPAQGRSKGEEPTVDGELLWSDSSGGWSSKNMNVTVGEQLRINLESALTSANLFRIRIPSFQ